MKVLIQNKDTHLYTTVHPNKGKESVILLHGGPGVPDGLTFVTEFLQQNLQVISFHQRGTLKSPTSTNNFSPEAYLSDLNRIADYFKLQQFHLFGHSWGGLYAQIYALKHPDKLLSLFLCSPATGTGQQYQANMLEIAQYNKAKTSLLEWTAMMVNSFSGMLGNDRGYKNFFQQALRNFSRGFQESHPEHFRIDCIKAKAINQTIKSILKAPLLPEKVHLGVKTTITYGDQDIIGRSKKYVIQRFPEATIIFIPACSHIPWSHNKNEFVSILEEHYNL